MSKRKQTSPDVASLAGSMLADPKSSKKDRRLAGSALAQAPPKRRKPR